jgi:hypothetical protein
VEIAAVGVSIAIFNQVSKVCIYPLVSVTTSFVAEEDAIISKAVRGNSSQEEDVEKASHVGFDPETSNLHASGTFFFVRSRNILYYTLYGFRTLRCRLITSACVR